MTIEKYQKQWDFLRNKFKTGRLSHAYLLSGPKETESSIFAREFIKLNNCLKPDVKNFQQGCGKCQNCIMIEKEIFPDLLVLRSENSESSVKNKKDMMEIDITQAREVQNFLVYKPFYGNVKSVIIENAERMNFQAQNCFLKTLEEPRGSTIIFLSSSKPVALLPTIISRCQEIKFFFKDNSKLLDEEKNILEKLLKVINSDLTEKFNYVKSLNLQSDNLNQILTALQKYFRQQIILLITQARSDGDKKSEYSIFQIKKILNIIETISYQNSIAAVNQKLALEVIMMSF